MHKAGFPGHWDGITFLREDAVITAGHTHGHSAGLAIVKGKLSQVFGTLVNSL